MATNAAVKQDDWQDYSPPKKDESGWVDYEAKPEPQVQHYFPAAGPGAPLVTQTMPQGKSQQLAKEESSARIQAGVEAPLVLGGAGLGGALWESAATRSLAPLYPIVRGIVGSAAGHYLGREAGGILGPKGAEWGGRIGGIAGGLYGGAGGKVPTKHGLIHLLTEPEEIEAGEAASSLPKKVATPAYEQPTTLPQKVTPTEPPVSLGSAPASRVRPPVGVATEPPASLGSKPTRIPTPQAATAEQPPAASVAAPTAEARPQYTYKPSEKASTMSEPRKQYGPEFDQQQWQEEVNRNKSILTNPRATAEDRAIANDRLRDAQEGLERARSGGPSAPVAAPTPERSAYQTPGQQGIRAAQAENAARMTLNPVGAPGARPLVANPAEQFEASFGPEHKEVGDLAEWETGSREGARPQIAPPAVERSAYQTPGQQGIRAARAENAARIASPASHAFEPPPATLSKVGPGRMPVNQLTEENPLARSTAENPANVRFAGQPAQLEAAAQRQHEHINGGRFQEATGEDTALRNEAKKLTNNVETEEGRGSVQRALKTLTGESAHISGAKNINAPGKMGRIEAINKMLDAGFTPQQIVEAGRTPQGGTE